MPNCPQMVVGYYGGMRAGAVMVPCSPLYVEAELEHQLRDAGASVVVCLSALSDWSNGCVRACRRCDR